MTFITIPSLIDYTLKVENMTTEVFDILDTSSEEEEEDEDNNDEEQEENEENEQEYVVERIDGWRYNLGSGQKEFYVKWEGYSVVDNTWEPEANLTNSHLLLAKFVSNLSAEESRSFHSRIPGTLNGFQRNASFKECVGSVGPHDSDSEESSKPDKQQFYILASFEDSDQVEEITLKDLAKHNKKAFVEFCERRLLSSDHDT